VQHLAGQGMGGKISGHKLLNALALARSQSANFANPLA